MSHMPPCRSGLKGNDGIATTVEYALLAGVSIVIFLALAVAVHTFSSTTEADAMAIAAYGVASIISSSSCAIVGPGDISGACEVDLPGEICGQPYLAYPSRDGQEICVSVSGCLYHAPVVYRANDVKMAGFIASSPHVHTVAYDAVSRTVTIT